MHIATRRTDVMTRREVFTFTTQHDDFDFIIRHRLAECRIELIGHLAVLSIVILRPIHSHIGDALFHFVSNGGRIVVKLWLVVGHAHSYSLSDDRREGYLLTVLIGH